MGRLHVAEGIVEARRSAGPGLWRLEVAAGTERRRALAYCPPLPVPAPGDRVALNTAAVDLALGTGGYDFVVHVFGKGQRPRGRRGHTMKLRYTPWQMAVGAVEEEDSPHHGELREAGDLAGMPAVVVALHSQLAPAATALRLALGPRAVVAYVMTDDAALPFAFSRTAARLRSRGVLDAAVTVGDAFGGDLEAVTLYSGLLAARRVVGADAAVVGPGPGMAGTGTTFGTTAIYAGVWADAVGLLGGVAVAAPRISFADPRSRHYGVSHHTRTAFGRVAQRRCTVVVPLLSGFRRDVVRRQLVAAGVAERHRVAEEPRGEEALRWLDRAGFSLRSMGRGPAEERPLFLAAAAAGFYAGRLAGGDDPSKGGEPPSG